MRLTATASFLLACSRSFVACRPSSAENFVDIYNRAEHVSQPLPAKNSTETAADVTEIIHAVHDFFQRGDFNFGDFVKRGAQVINDFALESEDPKLAARSPITTSVHEIRSQIDTGDVDLNKAAKDGIAYMRRATTDVDLNALAGGGLMLLRSKVDEHDLNDVVQGWLSQAAAPSNEGLGSRLRRNILTSAMNSIFSMDNFQGLAKVGMNTAIKMARNVDFNALANQGLNYLSSTVQNTDLNNIAGKETRSLDSLAESVDLNSLAAKGLDLLLG